MYFVILKWTTFSIILIEKWSTLFIGGLSKFTIAIKSDIFKIENQNKGAENGF